MLSQIILYTIIAIFIGISQSAGIGGGPVLNICLMVGGHYSTKQSMSITYVFMMGGAVASMIKNYHKLRPDTHTLLVDYNVIIVTLPMVASGSLFGTLTNHFLSQLGITILFTILLSYLCINTYKKLRDFNKSEAAQHLHPLMQISQKTQFNQPYQNTQLHKILQQQRTPISKDKLLVILLIFAVTIVTLLIKGGRSYSSVIGLDPCSLAATTLIFLHLALSYYCAKKIALQIIAIDYKKQQNGYVFPHQVDKMNEKKMWSCLFSGFAAGLIGGALGLGGAIILVPVWLNIGIDKQRATASSPFLIFFSALISFTICLFSNQYKSFMELSFYFGLAYIGSALVRNAVTYISQKYQLKSMIFILLLITMASSLFTLVPFQMSKFIANPQDFIKFGKFC